MIRKRPNDLLRHAVVWWPGMGDFTYYFTKGCSICIYILIFQSHPFRLLLYSCEGDVRWYGWDEGRGRGQGTVPVPVPFWPATVAPSVSITVWVARRRRRLSRSTIGLRRVATFVSAAPLLAPRPGECATARPAARWVRHGSYRRPGECAAVRLWVPLILLSSAVLPVGRFRYSRQCHYVSSGAVRLHMIGSEPNEKFWRRAWTPIPFPATTPDGRWFSIVSESTTPQWAPWPICTCECQMWQLHAGLNSYLLTFLTDMIQAWEVCKCACIWSMP